MVRPFSREEQKRTAGEYVKEWHRKQKDILQDQAEETSQGLITRARTWVRSLLGKSRRGA